ncbi:divalent metal cation transporter [Luteibacter rhizovicinus DSM 16549]|uniref:Divalent metal cation transporter MntH n=2 Tax=Luteibacter rhizovicinus TaxID=242606 RepID=A0A0G9HDP3_9GAMM|nr:divalent metal cation transporter [Luteibacter rhizovicinus DSM 16549]KLD67870.1 divalent metal cation transporter MntH [Luteibacter rhizovicinus DSM 16549]KLD78814.1 divalent metal cation transporter MntH [Xanthomonas hyacinthi DSM 19077]
MTPMFSLPKTATAPFCPSEVAGSIVVPAELPWWKKAARFAGPGLLVSVGYMDPGNWATDIEAGSRFGYRLLFVVLLSSLAAILLQCLAARLGIATRKDLARLSSERYPKAVGRVQWVLAEISIISCDLAEVLGSALAFKLLFNVSLPVGVALTALDTFIVLGLQGQGFRRVEAIILGLVGTIGVCFVVQLFLLGPDWAAVAAGFVPSLHALSSREPLYLAIGILGATIMPHNLYLHSSIVQTRAVSGDEGKRAAIRLTRVDTVASLGLALLINASILIVAASAFHRTGRTDVADISDAYQLLAPIAGSTVAALAFAIGLFASGQSSTFTGTIAGQVIMDGFLQMKLPCWQRRLITRGLAIIPAFIGVVTMGDRAIGALLVASQVVLSLQLPFAMYPLIRFTDDRRLMGVFANSRLVSCSAWFLFAVISAANLWLVAQVFNLA